MTIPSSQKTLHINQFILIVVCLLHTMSGLTQGCVAIRNVAGINPDLLFKNLQSGDKFILTITNRYFEAARTYRGEEFITDTLVRNKLYTLDLSLLRTLPKGWSIAFNVPISSNSRRNSNDHGGPKTPKHKTQAFGLGDIRFTVYKWLLDALPGRKGNIQAGLGIKFPTGDFKYEDYFFRNDSTRVLAPVDQAIQLGDGGTGLTVELSGFYALDKGINIFIQGFYLINPREQNGVSNLKGRSPTEFEVANSTTVMSVPDQYNVRGGANLQFEKVGVTAGLRYEQVPVNDLIGGRKGFRRAASILSAETGGTFSMNRTILFVNLGFPFKCNIVQNAQNNMTPAAFTNFVASFGASVKF